MMVLKSSFWTDFKAFALKGNVIDMAIGVIIGGAFGKIVTSLVNDVMLPILGACIGGYDFKNLKTTIIPAVSNEAGEVVRAAVVVNYGNFLQVTVDFFILSLCIFVAIRSVTKALEKIKYKEDAAAKVAPKPKKSDDVLLLEEIRDLLKEKTRES